MNGDRSAMRDRTDAGFAATLSSTTKGLTGQFKSMGSAMTSAYSKTKEAVSHRFNSSQSDDPTSLANMPPEGSLGPEIWVTNGQLYEAQGNFTKALDNYTKALELEPNNQAALLSTARLYNRQKSYAQATEFFNKSLALAPQAATYNELAMSLQGQGKIAEAQAAVKQAIEMDASNPRYRNNLAGMLVNSGRSDEAVKQLEDLFPPAVANYNVAFLHFQNKNLAAAQQHLQHALAIDPDLALARDLLNRISNNSAAQSAMAAYKTAEGLYRTAEATLQSSGVPANQAVYQLSPGLPTQNVSAQGVAIQGIATQGIAPQGATNRNATTQPQGQTTAASYGAASTYDMSSMSTVANPQMPLPQSNSSMLDLPTVPQY